MVPAELTGPSILIRLLAVFLLISINAFFVAAEFSIVSVRRSRISQLVAGGDIQAKTVQRLQRSLDRLLSTTQLGITLSSLALGWIGESTMAVILAFYISRLPLPSELAQILAHSISVPLAFFFIAYLQIVLGELSPKSVAILYPEQLARFLGPPSLTIGRLFHPFIWILNHSTQCLLKLLGIKNSGQFGYSRLTPEELQLIIRTSAESPGLEAEERALLSNVFAFRDVTAADVMIPRTQIDAVSEVASFREILEDVAQSSHSRYPVMGESLDDIRGLIDLKDLLHPLAQNQLALDGPIQPWIRPVRFVPEATPLHELLHTMQQTRQEVVMVVDEFGGTAGLVTLRDLISEIIGDAYTAADERNVLVKPLDDQSFLVKAQADLASVNTLLQVDLPLAEEYQSLGGFLMYALQKIPREGDRLVFGDYEWVVLSAEGHRLQEILARRLDKATESDADAPVDASGTATGRKLNSSP